MQLGRQQGKEWVTLLGKYSMPCSIRLIVSIDFGQRSRRLELALSLSAQYPCNLLQPR